MKKVFLISALLSLFALQVSAKEMSITYIDGVQIKGNFEKGCLATGPVTLSYQNQSDIAILSGQYSSGSDRPFQGIITVGDIKLSCYGKLYTRILKIIDYVSGMTDNYASSLYRKIKGISLPRT